MTAKLLQFLSTHQFLAIWLAAVGTFGAVIVSLTVAFRNRDQLATLLRTIALPTQISKHERAAQRLERNGSIFPTCRGGAEQLWVVPCDSRALKNNLGVLREMFSNCTDEQKKENIRLLIPHIEVLIRCHEELENITGIVPRKPK